MNSAFSVKAFVILVCVLSVSAAFRSYNAARSCPQPDAYGVERARSSMLDVADNVPKGAIVAYMSDLPTAEHAGGMALHAVQYALAPRLVVDIKFEPSPEWAIGWFSRPADWIKLGREHGLRLVRDFGNGVVLYGRDRP